jgi:hypothetical protein
MNHNWRLKLFHVIFVLTIVTLACTVTKDDVCQSIEEEAKVTISNMYPSLSSSSFTVVDSLTPTFRWSVSGPCIPSGWYMRVSKLTDPNNPVIYDTVDSFNNTEPTNIRPYFYTTTVLEPKTFYIMRFVPMWDNTEIAALYEQTFLFQTGTLCSTELGDSPPVPILLTPADGALENIGDGFILLEWQTDSACVWNYDYEVSSQVDFSHLERFGNLTGEMINLKALKDYDPDGPENPIEECTTYYWRVSVKSSLDEVPWSDTSSFKVSQYNGEECIQEKNPIVPIEPDLIVSINSNAFCRSGPSKVYPIVEVLQEGRQVVVEGRNQENTWRWVLLKESDQRCWVFSGLVENVQDPEKLPVIPAPPPPLVVTPILPSAIPPEPTLSCNQITSQSACMARSDCQWINFGSTSLCR